ncbi:hypothetical protein R6254_18725 [Polaromonas sp. SM01]|nr:hypothetical protein [Polaromonas sp. SM01]
MAESTFGAILGQTLWFEHSPFAQNFQSSFSTELARSRHSLLNFSEVVGIYLKDAH